MSGKGCAALLADKGAGVAHAVLVPGRLLAYVDAGRTYDSTAVLSATFDGAPLPVQRSWSCRTDLQEMCFMGYFVDLSAAGARADTNHSLVFTLPATGGGGTAPRVGYDMRNGDLPNQPSTLPSPDYNLCWALCNQTTACVAWAYGDSTTGCEPVPRCWMKSSVGPWDQDACRVAGVKESQASPVAGIFYDNVDSVFAALL